MSEQLFKIYIRNAKGQLRKVEVDEKTYKELLKHEDLSAKTPVRAATDVQVHPEVEYSDQGKSTTKRRSSG